MRRRVALATQDVKLARAGLAEGVEILK